MTDRCLGYIWKIEPMGSKDGLDVSCEKRKVKDDSTYSVPSYYCSYVAITDVRKERCGRCMLYVGELGVAMQELRYKDDDVIVEMLGWRCILPWEMCSGHRGIELGRSGRGQDWRYKFRSHL